MRPRNNCWLCNGQLYVQKVASKRSKRCPECAPRTAATEPGRLGSLLKNAHNQGRSVR